MSPAIRSEKNTARPIRKKYNASTRGAIVEADSGKSGVPVHMVRRPGDTLRSRLLATKTQHHEDVHEDLHVCCRRWRAASRRRRRASCVLRVFVTSWLRQPSQADTSRGPFDSLFTPDHHDDEGAQYEDGC